MKINNISTQEYCHHGGTQGALQRSRPHLVQGDPWLLLLLPGLRGLQDCPGRAQTDQEGRSQSGGDDVLWRRGGDLVLDLHLPSGRDQVSDPG